MCFNQPITALMAGINLSTAVWLTSKGRPLVQTQVCYAFFVMEFLQFLQYFVADDCGSRLNQITTILSYIHICFQPFIVNSFLFRHEPNRDTGRGISRLCLLGGVLMALRLPQLGLGYTPAWLRALVPELPDPALAGSPAVCAWEWTCGPRTCAVTGKTHIAWELPLLPPTYFLPSGFFHFFAMFGPPLLVPGVWMGMRRFGYSVLLVTGPLFASAFVFSYWHGPGARTEWPAVWCLYSVIHCLFALIVERVFGGEDPAAAAAERYAKLAAEGELWAGPAPAKAAPANGRAHANGKAE